MGEWKHTGDGGPAFPMPFSTDEHTTPCNASIMQPGMSLRDWFAGQALAGMLVSRAYLTGELRHDYAAHDSYVFADAMLAERTKANSGEKG